MLASCVFKKNNVACSMNAVWLPLDGWSSIEQGEDELVLTTGCLLSVNERYCSRQQYRSNCSDPYIIAQGEEGRVRGYCADILRHKSYLGRDARDVGV